MTSAPAADPDDPFADAIDDVAVVLVAAGDGARLGASRPKAFVGMGGEVLLARSLRAFEAHPAVDSIVLVVPEGWVDPTHVLVEDLGCDRVSAIEVGGSSRAASVLAGLAAVADRRNTAVLVHDAARPDVPEAVIDRVLAGLADGWDAVVPGLAVSDTVKRVDEAGGVVETLARPSLRAIQTPQACRASVLGAALRARTEAELAHVTDDAQVIEQAGGRVLVVAGDTRLEKFTDAADLRRVEARLAPHVVLVPETVSTGEDLEPEDEDDDL